jgi:hypothetical protein
VNSLGNVRVVVARGWQWLCALPPRVILAIGWLLFVVYAFPGLMTFDSFYQLAEGRAWSFTDLHPPAMAALWGVVDRIVVGPFGMLVIQGTAFLAGLYLILARAMRPRRAAVCASLLLLFPPVVAPMAVIWKDCQMAGFLVLGVAALFDERRWIRLVGLAALSLATAMRYNAPAATLPLVGLLFEWSPGGALRRYAIAAGAWIALTAVAFGVNAALVDQPKHVWSSFALTDIIGTLAHVEPDIPDDELRRELAPTGLHVDHDIHAAIRAAYKPFAFDPLIGGDGHFWDPPTNGTTPEAAGQRDAIARAWSDILTTHWGAYVRYRFEVFGEVLGTSRRFDGIVGLHRIQYPELLAAQHLAGGYSRYQVISEDVTMFFATRTRLFRPHLYLFLALALLAFCRRHRDILAILLSGIAMELSLLPLAATPDFRYSHWLVVCTCLALVMLIARRAREPARSVA